MIRTAILHGSGYVGRELIRLLLQHPHTSIACVTSRTYAGTPLHTAHPALRGEHSIPFTEVSAFDSTGVDIVFVAAEHGKGAASIKALLERGYTGAIIDMSSDFRFQDTARYESLFNVKHPAPELTPHFSYGQPEIFAPYSTHYIANPGCFATGILLSTWPLHLNCTKIRASVTAITGASGSGVRPKQATHFPDRDGNVRAYKVLTHQHVYEVSQFLHTGISLAMVPVSGPWTHGIWGIIQLPVPAEKTEIAAWFQDAYSTHRLIRLWPDELPELRYSVGTPFFDLGWIVHDGELAIGFGMDNMLRGAASQAIQNMNLLMNLPMETGLTAKISL